MREVLAIVHGHRKSAEHLGRGDVVPLPIDIETCFRLLRAQVRNLLGLKNGRWRLAQQIGFGSSTIYVDDIARVLVGLNAARFQFVLDTKQGRKTFLACDDVSTTAQFVAEYLISRHGCDPKSAARG